MKSSQCSYTYTQNIGQVGRRKKADIAAAAAIMTPTTNPGEGVAPTAVGSSSLLPGKDVIITYSRISQIYTHASTCAYIENKQQQQQQPQPHVEAPDPILSYTPMWPSFMSSSLSGEYLLIGSSCMYMYNCFTP